MKPDKRQGCIKPSTAQAELLAAMKNGVRVLYVPGLNAHFFRTDTYRRCSGAILILADKGFVKIIDKGYGKQIVELVEHDQP